MKIIVTDLETEDEIFVGDADEFLEENLYDEDLEILLNDLECGIDEEISNNEILITREYEELTD